MQNGIFFSRNFWATVIFSSILPRATSEFKKKLSAKTLEQILVEIIG